MFSPERSLAPPTVYQIGYAFRNNSTLPYLRSLAGVLVNDSYKNQFLKAAEDWVCDNYLIDIRYFAGGKGNQLHLWQALIQINPLPPCQDMSFHVETSEFYAGQSQYFGKPRQEILEVLTCAAQGNIRVHGHSFRLNNEQAYDFYSEVVHRDRWFSDLHLQTIGNRSPLPSAMDVANIDNALRKNVPPFDGVTDIASWLGINSPWHTQDPPSIHIRVSPPVDLIVPACTLEGDLLTLTLHAHPNFDVCRVGLAVRAVPGKFLESRRQVSDEIEWQEVVDGRRVGIAQVHLDQADSALVMLMIGDSTVRRQWFLDQSKARNSRLVALQHFDKDLRMVKQAVFQTTDSERFEKGVAALLFLLGFSPVLSVETNAPDIVVTTPAGRLVVVECTTRIADFNSKLGKLVDRKGALSKALETSSHYSRVDAVLVCSLPRGQIVVDAADLDGHQVILITKQEIEAAFDRLRFPNNPDELLDQGVASLAAGRNPLNG